MYISLGFFFKNQVVYYQFCNLININNIKKIVDECRWVYGWSPHTSGGGCRVVHWPKAVVNEAAGVVDSCLVWCRQAFLFLFLPLLSLIFACAPLKFQSMPLICYFSRFGSYSLIWLLFVLFGIIYKIGILWQFHSPSFFSSFKFCPYSFNCYFFYLR